MTTTARHKASTAPKAGPKVAPKAAPKARRPRNVTGGAPAAFTSPSTGEPPMTPVPTPDELAHDETPKGRTHWTGDHGDTLWSLACDYYRDGNKWPALLAANRKAASGLTGADVQHAAFAPGVKLVIPEGS